MFSHLFINLSIFNEVKDCLFISDSVEKKFMWGMGSGFGLISAN